MFPSSLVDIVAFIFFTILLPMSDKPRLAGAALVTVANGTLRAETVAFVILTNSATPSSEIKSVRDGFSRFLPQYWPLSQGEQLWRSIKREFQTGELR